MNAKRAVVSIVASLVSACGGMDAAPSSSAGAAETADAPAAQQGAVFTMTDDPVHNAVLSFARSADGSLAFAGSTDTGGAGSGGGEGVLGSQGALSLSADGRFLLAVDAGSDEVSSFRVQGASLTLVGRAPSGAELPVSVTVHRELVYVVNAGRSGSPALVSGLRLGPDGALSPLPGSTRPLSAAQAGPAQIAFDARGESLVVTEKATRALSVFAVGEDGTPSDASVFPSSGATPFGFGITRRGDVVVSEAQGGAPGGSSVSSYRLDDGALELGSASVGDGQTAACWLVVTRNGRHAFVADAASHDLSSYGIDPGGALTLVAGDAASIPAGKPLDLGLSVDDRFLYALDAGNHAIAAFGVGEEGTLASLPEQASGLPAHAVGIAVR